MPSENCPDSGERSDVIAHSPGPAELAAVTQVNVTSIAPQQASSDEQLIELWLHGRSRHTQRSYRADLNKFIGFAKTPLHAITLGDLQAFADSLAASELAHATQHRTLSAVKSLFAFGYRLGYLKFDTARPLRLPAIKSELAARILDEGEVLRMIALERHPRNHVLLLLLYAAGLRASEICGLTWEDVQARDAAGQITVLGKGSKTRHVLVPASAWTKLIALRGDRPASSPIFRSRKRGHLQPQHIWRIVRKAAIRAGIEKAVSTHWLRHAHASHSLDRGAAISLVQATLGHASVATTGRYLHARPNDSSGNYLPL